LASLAHKTHAHKKGAKRAVEILTPITLQITPFEKQNFFFLKISIFPPTLSSARKMRACMVKKNKSKISEREASQHPTKKKVKLYATVNVNVYIIFFSKKG
jgi:hypothetical protein